MPHKHVRKRGNDAQHFDLPPSALAKSLPTFKKTNTKKNGKGASTVTSKPAKPATKLSYGADDTPRAFARMMNAPVKKRSSGLDEGERPAKKQKKVNNKDATIIDNNKSTVFDDVEKPKLLPGERLSDFAARVDQSMPISGLAKKGKVSIEGVKERRTKTEKRLHKMYAEWREEEAKIKAREEEQAENAEEEEEDMMADHGGQAVRFPESKRSRRQRAIGEIGEMNDDPWAVLKNKREAPKGLHDVVQAPPDLKVIPKEKFNVRNGAKVKVANIPASAGSLKKREELSEARREVIERYRAMMKNGK